MDTPRGILKKDSKVQLINIQVHLGYEILSEPQVHTKDQWTKIGKYNTFMADDLRKLTEQDYNIQYEYSHRPKKSNTSQC